MTNKGAPQARRKVRFNAVVAQILLAVIVGGCAGTTVTYTYEPLFSLPESGTYQWGKAKPPYHQDPLLEANVRFLADRALEAKGLTAQTDKAGLLVWIGYEFDPIYSNRFQLQLLTVNVARTDNNVLLWRGLATGTIKTDAASGDLKNVVQEMFVNFPSRSSLPAAKVTLDSAGSRADVAEVKGK